jgi:hypothetical protein
MIFIREQPMSVVFPLSRMPLLVAVTVDSRMSREPGPLSAASGTIRGFVIGVVVVARGALDRATRR